MARAGRITTAAATPPAHGPTLRVAPTPAGAFHVTSASPRSLVVTVVASPVGGERERASDAPVVTVEHGEHHRCVRPGHDRRTSGVSSAEAFGAPT